MYLRLISLKRIIQVWWDNWKKNLMGIQVYTRAQRLLKMKYIFWINFHTPIEKQSNKDWNILIHLKNNGPSIKICLICWFLVMTFNLWFYHQFWVKWVCIHTGNSSRLMHNFQNVFGCLTLNEMHIKLASR